ncbi:MAG: phosphoglucosamine mutase [Deltaproteobacteria bacterium]|nr:phosphoglucosamine mutase [Deltaproteobacteria bacterium]
MTPDHDKPLHDKPLFGTDGIRGVANRHPMTPELVLQVGRAVCAVMGKGRADVKIVIGKDTRKSGDMLVSALASGICSQGGNVYMAGVIPTPGVAFLAKEISAHAGIMVSASHNPYEDNGIKVFDSRGFKLSDDTEQEIEKRIANPLFTESLPSKGEIGVISDLKDAETRYERFLTKGFAPGFLKGVRLVIDCSNGAASSIAPKFFSGLGADVTVLFNDPDGKNINNGCGSQHIETLAHMVVEKKADIGLAFDGDADRMIAVDESGRRITGDQVLFVCAGFMKDRGLLKNNLVVSTVMSNVGLGLALANKGISHLITDVGDRQVLKAMRENNALIGGEDSGHTIYLDRHTTGDGILTGLRLLQSMVETGRPVSELSRIMAVYPQVLKNIRVCEKSDFFAIPEIAETISKAEKKLSGRGRVLVRYSGTRPLCRVMVEGPDRVETEALCDEIVAVIKKHFGMEG